MTLIGPHEVKITFSGKPNSGKTTLLRIIARYLRHNHFVVIESIEKNHIIVLDAKPHAKPSESAV